jgi:hypothetical protein
LGLIFIILACTKQTTSGGKKPEAVELIAGVADTCRSERGIDTVPHGNLIRLEWIPSGEEEVTDYDIYRSENRSGPYVHIQSVSIPDSSYEDGPLSIGVRYFYYVFAITDENLKSTSSDTLDYMLLMKAANLQPGGNTSQKKPAFTWQDLNSPTAHEYIIRFQEEVTNKWVGFSVIQSSYQGGWETIPFDSVAFIDSLKQGVNYKWRVDIVGPSENSGSESSWIPVTLQ